MADSAWAAAGFKAEGGNDWESAGFKPDPGTSPNQFGTAPDAAVSRLQAGQTLSQYGDDIQPAKIGKSLQAILDAAKEGGTAGLDAKGFANTWAGINNATADMSNANPAKALNLIADAIVKPIDAAGHLMSGAVGAIGSAVGQAFGEAIGAQGQTEGFKETATDALNIGTMMAGSKPGPLLAMKDGRVARLIHDETTGKVEAEPLGPMPTPEMVQQVAQTIHDTAGGRGETYAEIYKKVSSTPEYSALEKERLSLLSKSDGAMDLANQSRYAAIEAKQKSLIDAARNPQAAVEAKIAKYWQKQGVHPAEVLDAAQNSPVMARDLSSASTPPMPLPERPGKQWLNELNDRLFALKGNKQQDEVNWLKSVKAMPSPYTDLETNAKWYAHGEADPQAAPMTPSEAKGFNEVFLPLKKREDEAAKNLAYINATIKPNEVAPPIRSGLGYMHRMVMGKTPEIDRHLMVDESSPMYGASKTPLTTTPSGAKARDYFALESPNGERQLVKIDGKSIFAVKKGEALDQLRPGTESDHRLENRDIRLGDHLDFNGSDWYVKDAYTREIEDNTDLQYHKHGLLSVITNINQLEAAERAAWEIQRTRSSPEWAASTQGEYATYTPQHPMFRNDKMDPLLGHVLDNYWNGDKSSIPFWQALEAVNHAATSSLFITPLGHDLNMLSDAVVANGWQNFNPLDWRDKMGDVTKAVQEVARNGPIVEQLHRAGMAFQYPGAVTPDFYNDLLQQFGHKIVKEPSKFGILGDNPIMDIARGWMIGVNKSLWKFGDVLSAQHAFGLMRRGMSQDEAIQTVNRNLATYRTAPDFAGNKELRDIFYNTEVFRFSRYHGDAIKINYNLINDLIKGSGQGRVDAIGRLVTLATLGLLVGPALSAAYDKMTGSTVKFGPYGAARYIYPGFKELVKETKSFWPKEVRDYYIDNKDFLQQLSMLLNPTPVAATAQSLISNKDFAGRAIRQGGLLQQGGQMLETGAQQFAPYSDAMQAYQEGLSPLDAAMKFLINPRDLNTKAEGQAEKAEGREDRAAATRTRKPRGLIEAGVNKLDSELGE